MRLNSMLCGDMFFQRKYGFYFIYAVLCVIYIAVLQALPAGVKQKAAAILIFSDPAAMGLFFMGAIVLLEKSQRVLHAIAVSPVTSSEYIVSKLGSLALISAAVAAVIGAASGSFVGGFVDGGPAAGGMRMLFTLVGTILASAIFTLIGMIAAVGTESLNQFMVVSVVIEVFCFVPPIVSVIRPDLRWLALYPFNAAMRLIDGSHNGRFLGDVGISLLLIAVLFYICRRRVERLFRQVGGVKL